MSFQANEYSVYIDGKEWPPIVRDNHVSDKNFFPMVAEGLNSLPRYRFIVKKLKEVQDQNAVVIKETVLKILTVLKGYNCDWCDTELLDLTSGAKKCPKCGAMKFPKGEQE